MPSICPLRIAASEPAVEPTPMIATSDGFSPPFARYVFSAMLVDDPGAETPNFRPFRSFGPLMAAAFAVATPIEMAGARPISTKARMCCPRTCMLSVCSYAPATMSTLPPTSASSDLAPPAKSLISTVSPSSLK